MALWILSVTTWVSQYQKKHSPTHTYHGHQSSLISFLHLLWTMASSLFNLCAWSLFPQSLSKFLANYTIGRAFGTMCRLSVCLSSSVTFCIVAKRYVLAKKGLKEWIGNQGQKVDFLGRHHISTSFRHYGHQDGRFCPYSQAIGTRW